MAQQFTDRAYEACSVVGTGDVTLTGAKVGFQPLPEGESTCVIESSDNEWEVVEGIRVGPVFQRVTVVNSSNGGSKVNFQTPTEIAVVIGSKFLENLESDFAGKANKVAGAVAWNFAGLDAQGDLIDLGLDPSIIIDISDDLVAHENDATNPHVVTKVQVGLGNVDNTSDANKPVGTATQVQLDAKASKQPANVGEIAFFSGSGDTVGNGTTFADFEPVDPNIQIHIGGGEIHVTKDQSDALDMANAPSMLNPVMTVDDLPDTTAYMRKDEYDTNSSGISDKAESLDDGTSSISAAEVAKQVPLVYSKEPSNSGLIDGGLVTLNTSTTINIAAGNGILSDNFTDTSNVTTSPVAWTDNNNVTLAMSGNFGVTYIFIDSGGNIQQISSKPTGTQLRTNIRLAAVYHSAGSIDEVIPYANVVSQVSSALQDYFSFQDLPEKGLDISPVNAAVSVYRLSGSIFGLGLNWFISRTSPNIKSVSQVGDATTPLSFTEVLQDSAISNASATVFPQYTDDEVGGTVPLTGTQATIHYIMSVGSQFVVQVGVNIYDDYDSAVSELGNDLALFPFVSDIVGFTLEAQIVVSNGSTSFDGVLAQIFNAGTIAGGSGGGGGGGSDDHNVLLNRNIPDQHPIGAITGLTTTLDGKEPLISPKNTAFNQDFGTGSTDVARGNHLHSGIYEPANSNIQEHIAKTTGQNPHGTTAINVPYDPSSDPVSSATDVQQGMLDHSTSIEQRVASASGIISGGRLVAGTDPNTEFTVLLGSGEIVDSYTNPQNTSIIEVSWSSFTDVVVDVAGLDATATKIYITSAPSVLQVPGATALGTARNNIFVGVVYTINGQIVDLQDTPSIVKQTATDTYDSLTDNIRVSGVAIRAVNNFLRIWTEDGSLFFPGINYYNDTRNPNKITLPQQGDSNTAMAVYMVTQDGAVSATPVTDIPTDINAADGVITPLPGNNATIHRLYSIGVNPRNFLLLYGQNEYNNASVAKDNLFPDGENTTIPPLLEHIYFLGYVCVSGNSDDFASITNAWIVSGLSGQTTSGTADTTDHDALANREILDQHPIEAIGTIGGEQLRPVLDSKTVWKSLWQSQEYLKNEMVLDGEWTMIANATTSDRAAPQPTGDPAWTFPELPPWVDSSLVGDLAFGYDFVSIGMYATSGWRIWITDTAANEEYTVQLWDMNNTLQPILIASGFVEDGQPEGWHEVLSDGSGDILLPLGSKYRFIVIVHSTIADQTYTGVWRYLNSGTTPAAGVVLLNSDTKLHINYNEASAGPDRSAELILLKTNDTFTLTQAVDSARSSTYRLTADAVDNGTYIELSVVLQSSEGALLNNQDINAEWVTHGIPTQTDYVNVPDGLLTYPETGIKGFITQDLDGTTGPVTLDDDIYGLDLKTEPFISSPDWDLVAFSGGGGSGGGGISGGGQVDSVSGGTNLTMSGTATDPIVNLNASVDSVILTQTSYNQAFDITDGNIGFSNGDMVKCTAVADLILTFSGFISGQVCTLIIDAVNWGNYTITHPVGTIFDGGVAPVYTVSGTDRLLIVKDANDVYSLSVMIKNMS